MKSLRKWMGRALGITSIGNQNNIINAQSIGQIIINNIGQKRVWIPFVVLSVTILILVTGKRYEFLPKEEASPIQIDSLVEKDNLRDTLQLNQAMPPQKSKIVHDSLTIILDSREGAEIGLKDLIKDQTITIQFEGEIGLGFFAGSSGPDGILGFAEFSYFPNIPHGAVIGRWKEDSDWHFVGGMAEFVVPSSGDQTLEFLVNDADYSNNLGGFQGVIVY